MLEPREIKISDYNYPLDTHRIAKYPLAERSDSKLLLYRDNKISDRVFHQVKDLIPSDSRLIFNNTKVIRARLRFRKSSGAKIEIFCLEPYEPADYVLAFESTQRCCWTCMIGNAKKWKTGCLEQSLTIGGEQFTIEAKKLEQESSAASPVVEFSWNNERFSFSEIIEALGELPIPPYLNRATESSDIQRYQTVYSKQKGSVAAPTAGLHFTEPILSEMKEKGVDIQELTLHVGAGTFKPVKSELIAEHEMHTEHFFINKSFLEALKEQRYHVLVGTTSVRTIESMYWMAVKLQETMRKDDALDASSELHLGQWEAYRLEPVLSRNEALEVLLKYLDLIGREHIDASTSIMIAPSYQFQFTDAIITNFHQPKSTLLLLVSAFIGAQWKNVYQHALDHDYRFLSYGDSSLLIRGRL